jgi:hypothetical protein
MPAPGALAMQVLKTTQGIKIARIARGARFYAAADFYRRLRWIFLKTTDKYPAGDYSIQ